MNSMCLYYVCITYINFVCACVRCKFVCLYMYVGYMCVLFE